MTTFFKNRFLPAGTQAAALLLVTNLSPTTGLGQAPGPAAVDDPFAENRAPVTKFDFDFPGGTLEEFAGLLMEVYGDVSITIPTAWKDAEVPEMKLRKIGFGELMDLVMAATERSKTRISFEEISPGRWLAEASFQEEPRELAIFPVENTLRKRAVDDIIAVVSQAFEIAGIESVPQFHLHKETSILMASLTKTELKIVERLITALETRAPDGTEEREEKRRTVARKLADQKHHLQVLSSELAEMVARLATVEDQEEKSRINFKIKMLGTEQRLLESEITSYMQILARLRAAELGVGDDFEVNPVTPAARGGRAQR